MGRVLAKISGTGGIGVLIKYRPLVQKPAVLRQLLGSGQGRTGPFVADKTISS